MKCCHQFRMLAVLCARAPPYTVATKSYGRTARRATRSGEPRHASEPRPRANAQERGAATAMLRLSRPLCSTRDSRRTVERGVLALAVHASRGRARGRSPHRRGLSKRRTADRVVARSGQVLDRCPKCPFVSRMFRSNDKEKTYDDDLSSPLLARSIPQAKLNHYLL